MMESTSTRQPERQGLDLTSSHRQVTTSGVAPTQTSVSSMTSAYSSAPKDPTPVNAGAATVPPPTPAAGSPQSPQWLDPNNAASPAAPVAKRSNVAAAEASSSDQTKVELTPVEKIQKAAADGDADALINELHTATVETLQTIAKHEDTVKNIFKLRNTLKRNSILDRIYDGIENVELLKDAISLRFGVPLGKSKCSEEDATQVDQITSEVKENGQTVNKSWSELEKPWTTNGAIHVYRVYLRLPQVDLDKIRCVLTFNTTSGCRGTAVPDAGIYHVDYTDTAIEKTETHEHIDRHARIEDSRKGLVLTDMTIAHELGHIVDAAQSKPYSQRQDFRELNGWKEYSINYPQGVFNAIKDAMYFPFRRAALTPKEMDIADQCGKKAIEQKAKDLTDIVRIVTNTVNEKYVTPTEGNNRGGRNWVDFSEMLENSEAIKSFIGRDRFPTDGDPEEHFASFKTYLMSKHQKPFIEDMTPEESRIADLIGAEIIRQKANNMNAIWRIMMHFINHDYQRNAGGRGKDELIQLIKESNAINTIPKLWAERTPWYEFEPFTTMKYQIHQGYKGQSFFSYKTESLNGKISKYQFRSPEEDFAETYATFFVANPIGSKTPPLHRAWFIQNNLDVNHIHGRDIGRGGIHGNTAGNNTPRES